MNNIRKSCKDIWNAFMVEGATFSPNDIPYCPTTSLAIPKSIITWREANAIYKKHIIKRAPKKKKIKNLQLVQANSVTFGTKMYITLTL